jgi:RNA polymerase sigma factor (sigma-70 family)
MRRSEAWIVSHNLPLVDACLRGRWSRDDATFEDLTAAGYLGLCRAVKTYDPEIGVWSTYAIQWIRRFIQIELQNRSLLSDAPRRVQWDNDEAAEALAVMPIHRPEDQVMAQSIVSDGLRYLSDRERYIVEQTWMRGEAAKTVARDLGLSYSRLLVIRDRAKQVLMRRLDKAELQRAARA